MPRSIVWLHARAGAALIAFAVFAQAGEMPFKNVPKAVQQTVLGRFKGAKVVGAAQEKAQDGKLVFEVSLKDKGKNIDATLAPTGELITIEKEIAFSELPQPAADTLGARYPKARYKIVEVIYTVEGGKETLAYYEALLMDAHKQAWATEIAGDGTVLKVEKKKGLTEEDEE